MRVSPTANQQSVLLLSSCAVAPTARFGRMCNDTSERQCCKWQCGSNMPLHRNNRTLHAMTQARDSAADGSAAATWPHWCGWVAQVAAKLDLADDETVIVLTSPLHSY